MKERIVAIEERIAFYEKTVDELSGVIYEQHKEIAVLQQKVASLELFQKTSGDTALKDAKDETPPPHW
ncbi:MAG: SlyX family protein [Chitinivibrionia bacterium]|nr:SlyX family protein [Chitinivibrionia bacterium]